MPANRNHVCAIAACAAVSIAASLAVQYGHSDIIKASWKANGVVLTATEKASVTTAINLFKNLSITIPSAPVSRSLRATTINLTKCADCMKKMLAKNRICRESNLTGNHGAVTAADASSKCNPASDGVNVRTDLFPVPEMLAAVLAHEWCHTAQANAMGTANFEIPCYEVEIEVLKKLKAGAAAGNQTAIQNRIDQMQRCVNDLKTGLAGSVIAPKTLAFGGNIHQSPSGRAYSAFSGSGGFLFMGDATTPEFSQPLVAITRPFNLEVVDDFFGLGVDGVFVSGLDEVGGSGFIEIYEGNPSVFGASARFVIELPGVHPFDMAFDGATSTLFVLDTANSQIQTMQFDPAFDPAIPPIIGLFADSALAPGLSSANAIELLPPSPTGGMRIVAHEEDLRHVDRTGSFELTQQTTLTDTDHDMIADVVTPGTFLDDFQVVPGYPDPIREGDPFLRVIGTAGSAIEVDVVDPVTGAPLEVVGSTTIPTTDRIGFVELFRPLLAGEAIVAKDLTVNFNLVPVPETVRPPCSDLDGDNVVGPSDLLALLANFNTFGPSGLLALLSQFGQPCP